METKMFWGVFFTTIGVILLIKYVLGIHLPVMRILVALGFIYIGVNMLFGTFGFRIQRQATDTAAIFSTSQFQFTMDNDEHKSGSGRHYQTVFGEGVLDLTDVDLSKGSVDLDVKTVFGETQVLVKKGTPIRIQTNTVFGGTELPNKNFSALGKFTYATDGLSEGAPALNIHSDVVFGSFRIIEK
jgi:predicted membrane protein